MVDAFGECFLAFMLLWELLLLRNGKGDRNECEIMFSMGPLLADSFGNVSLFSVSEGPDRDGSYEVGR